MSHDPLFPDSDDSTKHSAVELIRAKIARAYKLEPDAMQELVEAEAEDAPSKHQLFMRGLAASGKSLAQIQTEWHHYYTTLSDAGKHEVWQEFYAANQHTPYHQLFQKRAAQAESSQPQPTYVPEPAPRANQSEVVVADHTPELASYKPPKPGQAKKTTARAVKRSVANRVSAGGKLSTKHHLQSIGFGLASGFVVLVLFLFTFFNEYIIAPFIQPSRNVSSTPIILSGGQVVAADAPPSVTVPKINIQIPINFAVTSYDEPVIENGLKSGVVHYPTTVLPGQNGNAAYFGHSSGNIFNNGKYKFAFTLLHDVTTGDLFYITYNGQTYAYRVFDREIVPPSDVEVINDTKGKQATATLITCDPPGISTNRLVLWGEQISPAPTSNTAPPAPTTQSQPTALSSNGPTLWNRFVNWLEFWN